MNYKIICQNGYSFSPFPHPILALCLHHHSLCFFTGSVWWGCSLLILFFCALSVQGPKPSMSFVWMDLLICPGLNISTAKQIIQICSLKQTNFMGFSLLYLSRILCDPFSHSRIMHILIKPREMRCLLKIKYCHLHGEFYEYQLNSYMGIKDNWLLLLVDVVYTAQDVTELPAVTL